MCLKRVDKKIRKTNGYGYKVFDERAWGLYGFMYTLSDIGEEGYQLGEYYDCNEKSIEEADDYRCYTVGFHIFESLQAAKKYAKGYPEHYVYRVRYSKVVATGHQPVGEMLYKCVVAKRMKILNKVNR